MAVVHDAARPARDARARRALPRRARRRGRRDRRGAGHRHDPQRWTAGARDRVHAAALARCGPPRPRRSSAPTSCAGRSTRDDAALAAATDDAALVDGGRRDGCAWWRRRPENVKVTTATDLRVVESAPVLTDYHVHLRPDEDGSTAGALLHGRRTSTRYREAAAERGIEELGVAEHIHRFVQALDVWDAPLVPPLGGATISTSTATSCATPGLRLGIEADYLPGPRGPPRRRCSTAGPGTTWWARSTSSPTRRSTSTASPTGRPGTSGARTTPRRSGRATSRRSARRPAPGCSTSSPIRTWSRSGVPGWGVPDGDLRRFYERAMDGIAESDVAIEVSTAGLRKPVAEIYPAGAVPRDVPGGRAAGRAVERRPHARAARLRVRARAWSWLDGLGVSEIAVFEGRARRLEPLG